jgi:hypothetical protein
MDRRLLMVLFVMYGTLIEDSLNSFAMNSVSLPTYVNLSHRHLFLFCLALGSVLLSCFMTDGS